MRGMSEKEILDQRKRGINTVTQFACTFRPKSIGLKRKQASQEASSRPPGFGCP